VTFPVSLLLGALIAMGFAAVSRAAMEDFSLSDMEDLLRRRQRTKDLLPRVEAFAEHLDAYAFSFALFDLWSKLALLVALYLVTGAMVPEIPAFWREPLTLGGFALGILAFDVPLRPAASAAAEQVTYRCLGLWRLLYALLYLPNLPFTLVDRGIRRLLRRGGDEEAEEQAEEDIRAAVALGELQGQIGEAEGEMIQSILSLGDLTAEEIMTPRTDMQAIPADMEAPEAIRTAKESGHSRLPVYRQNRDDIVGILYVKDVIGDDPGQIRELEKILRKPFLVPASKPVDKLLEDLRRYRVHLAVVIDEYGGTAGVVTIEDIIEHVFGEIEDEYDAIPEDEMRHLDESAVDLDARMKVNEINERLDLNLPESESYESLGGLITTLLGRIPKEGASWEQDGVRLTVLQATDRRVVRVHLERLETASVNGPESTP